MLTTKYLRLPVTFDDEKTDLDSLGTAIDRLIETAVSTPGVLDEYGPVEIGDTEISEKDRTPGV